MRIDVAGYAAISELHERFLGGGALPRVTSPARAATTDAGSCAYTTSVLSGFDTEEDSLDYLTHIIADRGEG
jgi:hypothetical protein